MIKIAFVAPDGTIYTEGTIAYIHDYDTNLEEPEQGPDLQDLGVILEFVKNSFAPDYWTIKDGEVKRFSKKGAVG